MRKTISLILLGLLCSVGSVWADVTLFNVDFTQESQEQITTTNSSATFVAKTYQEYDMSFGVKSGKSINILDNNGGLQFSGNNYSNYMCLAIPLTVTANKKITVTITLPSAGKIKYEWKTGALPNTPPSLSGTTYSTSSATNTLEYTPTGTSCVLYLGRSGDSAAGAKVVSSIVITQEEASGSYTVTYAANGGTGDQMPNSTGTSITLKSNEYTAPTNYSFSKWNTANDGSGTSYTEGQTGITDDLDLYATWTQGGTLYANGGSANTTYTATLNATSIAITSAPTKDGYALLGYYTAADGGTKIAKSDGTLVASTSYTDANSKWNNPNAAPDLYAHWQELITFFSMTNITGPSGNMSKGETKDVVATFVGGSAQVFQNKDNQAMLVGNSISLNGSGSSYLHVSLTTNKLQAGDVISATVNDGDDWKIGTTTSNASAKSLPYTLTAEDAFIGATDLYIFKNNNLQISALTIKGVNTPSNLTITSSNSVNITVGFKSTITHTTSSSGAIIYTSSDEDVATVSSDGVITAVGGGTATISINQAADATYRAGIAKVTVTVPEVAIIKLKLKTTVTGTIGGTADVSAQNRDDEKGGCKLGSKGNYAGITLASEETFKTGDVVVVKIGSAGGGKIIFYDSKEQTNILYDTDQTPNAGSYRFVLPAAANGKSSLYLVRGADKSGKNEDFNPYIDYIAVYRAPSISTLSGRSYASYVTDQKLDFSAVSSEITAYISTGFNGAKDAIVLSPVDVVPAGTPIIVSTAAQGATVSVPLTDADADDVSANKLVAGDDNTAWNGTTGYTYFYLASDLFHKAIDGILQKGKAYLKVVTGDAPSAPSAIRIDLGDNTATSIDTIEAVEEGVKFIQNGQLYIKRNGVVYDAMGRVIR